MEVVIIVHATCVALLAFYAAHQAFLLALYLLTRQRHSDAPPCLPDQTELPHVTVQIPLYNERHRAERVIRAVARLRYPREKLHIQVLDDSTDETTTIAQRLAQHMRSQGVDITLLHRPHRSGYKAGALALGLAHTSSELIAIFDADFVPPPDFLWRVIVDHGAFRDPRVGFVQTRWTFLNRDASPLTRAQALMLDAHFHIEQPARSCGGLLINFNGAGGVWRRACILAAGGWQGDTLTEDLDLSYRAQLAGWRGVYLGDVSAPSDLPLDVWSYKQQQGRWARGALQTLRKLLPALWRAPISPLQRWGALMHLSGYFVHLLIWLTSLTTPLIVIALWTRSFTPPLWLNALSALTLAPLAAMFAAHRAQQLPLKHFLRDLPGALLLGVGVSFSNTVALARGALHTHHSGDFVRTPKGPVRSYFTRPDWTMWAELLLAIYAALALAIILQMGIWAALLPLMLYALGFGSVGLSQIARRLEEMR